MTKSSVKFTKDQPTTARDVAHSTQNTYYQMSESRITESRKAKYYVRSFFFIEKAED